MQGAALRCIVCVSALRRRQWRRMRLAALSALCGSPRVSSVDVQSLHHPSRTVAQQHSVRSS